MGPYIKLNFSRSTGYGTPLVLGPLNPEACSSKLLFCFCFNNPNIYLDERKAIE